MTDSWEKLKKSKDVVYNDLSIDDLFKKPDLNVVNEGLFITCYGRTGSGKTHLGLTMAEILKGPVFIIDTEVKSVEQVIAGKKNDKFRKLSEEGKIKVFRSVVKEPKEIEINGIKKTINKINFVKSLEKLERAIDLVCDYAIENPEPKGGVIIDSASEFWTWHKHRLDHLLEKGELKTTKDGAMMRTEWGKANAPYTESMYQLMDCGFDVFITGKSKEIYDKSGKETGQIKGHFQSDTETWAIVRGELVKVGDKREFRILKSRMFDSGTVIKDPTFKKIKKFAIEGVA